MSDNLFNGRRFRALTVVDNFSRECLTIHAGKSLKREDVISVMEGRRGLGKRLPVRIQTDYPFIRCAVKPRPSGRGYKARFST